MPAGVPMLGLSYHDAEGDATRPREVERMASWCVGPRVGVLLALPEQPGRRLVWANGWAGTVASNGWAGPLMEFTSLLPDTRRALGLVRLCLRACPCLACRIVMLRVHEKWNEWRRGALGLAWACSWLCLNSPVDVSCGPTRSLPTGGLALEWNLPRCCPTLDVLGGW